MLCLLFMPKKQKCSLESKVLLIQQGDTTLQNELIHSYKPFVAKTVSSVCKRYIHESDDEFSIGLIAFNEAIQKYTPEKGNSLISFSEVLIKHRVIDYIRLQSTKYNTLSIDTVSQDGQDNHEHHYIDIELSIEDFKKKKDEELRKEEILQFNKKIHQYDLSIKDLIQHSPKHADARKNAMMVAKILTENESLKNSLIKNKRLPMKQLESYVPLSRKTLERNRKYIIAISLILMGDYVYLKDYLKGVLET